ncbi:hypothetical protein Y032_0014g2389 [Ancylostoma ceylanicum]|uniref:Receptor L-domain domain-containing protein n=2 Tax=Ancylostoma ceylanicum TaxID=53326 RepID=A0A016V985_9BILA|nr:hypothetical protein Y032_0014g2389 [Ancylostoma ceylanicum]
MSIVLVLAQDSKKATKKVLKGAGKEEVKMTTKKVDTNKGRTKEVKVATTWNPAAEPKKEDKEDPKKDDKADDKKGTSECVNLQKIEKTNIEEVLNKCKEETELGGELFNAAESGLTEEQIEQLFRSKTTIYMCVRIVGTSFTKLDLSSVRTIKASKCGLNKGESAPALVVEDNQKLTKFLLSPKLVVEYPEKSDLPMMRFRNNPLLETTAALKFVFGAKNSEILEEGECHLVHEVKTFDELKHCKKLTGNITLSKSIEQDPPARFRMHKINGCLRIDGTTITNIDFLVNTVMEEVTCTHGRHGEPTFLY